LLLLFFLYFVSIVMFRKNISFRNKHVLITGGSQGLGLAFAKLMAKKGANITIIARDKTILQQAVTEINKDKENEQQIVIAISADVVNVDQINSAVKEAEEKIGIADFVVASHGFAQPGLFLETPNEVFKQHMDVNYLGVVNLVKAAIPSIVKRGKGGNIVLVSSAAALIPITGYSMYCPSKFAVRALADTLRQELKLYNIDVSIYYPANIDSPGLQRENTTKAEITKEIEGTAKLYSPEEAALILYNGIKRGDYHITPELIVDLGRMASHGLTPRNNWLYDLIFLPFMIPITYGFLWFFDYMVISYSKKHPSKFTLQDNKKLN